MTWVWCWTINWSRLQTWRQSRRKAWAGCTFWGGSGPLMSATGCSRCSMSLLLQHHLFCRGVLGCGHQSEGHKQTELLGWQSLLLALSLSPWRRWQRTGYWQNCCRSWIMSLTYGGWQGQSRSNGQTLQIYKRCRTKDTQNTWNNKMLQQLNAANNKMLQTTKCCNNKKKRCRTKRHKSQYNISSLNRFFFFFCISKMLLVNTGRAWSPTLLERP